LFKSADVPLWLYDTNGVPKLLRSSVPARAPSRLVPPSANYSLVIEMGDGLEVRVHRTPQSWGG